LKAIKILLIALGLLIALFLIAGLFAPKEKSVTQSTMIKAPPFAIFQHIKYMDKMAKWHPLLKKDQAVNISVSGQDGSVGAKRIWKSTNGTVGEGMDEIILMEENKLLKSKIKVISPRESSSSSTFSLVEVENQTKVTWAFDYSVPYPFNAFLLFGGDSEDKLNQYFAEGLTGLKNTLERIDRTAVKYTPAELKYRGGTFIHKRASINWKDRDDFVKNSYAEVSKLCKLARLGIVGKPQVFIFAWDAEDDIDIALGVPVNSTDQIPEPFILTVPPNENCEAIYVNDLYGDKLKAHRSIQKYFKDQGVVHKYPIIEEYVKSTLTGQSEKETSIKLIYQK